MKKTAYSPLIIASIILVASIGAGVVEYYVLNNSETRVVELQKKVLDQKAEIARAERARSALASLDTNENALEPYFLKKESIVSFIESLQATGKGTGASVQVVSVSDDKSGGHARILVSLLISGPFDAVMRTVGILENGSYDTVLNSLTLDSGTPSIKGVQQWSAATNLSVGLYQPPVTPPIKP